MRLLVTNDDGIEAPGLLALALAAEDAGAEVVVAAPSWDSSGASASLTAVEQRGRVVLDPRGLPGLAGDAYALDAAPAFIVRLALHDAFGRRPDAVLSGINDGPNTGHAVLHSGTVGAALTAVTEGVPAMALSLDVGSEQHWSTAAGVAQHLLRLLDHRAAAINVNVPNVAPEALAGVRAARLADFGAVQTTVTEADGDAVQVSYRAVDADPHPDSDVALLREGHATVTPVSAVCEAEIGPMDL